MEQQTELEPGVLGDVVLWLQEEGLSPGVPVSDQLCFLWRFFQESQARLLSVTHDLDGLRSRHVAEMTEVQRYLEHIRSLSAQRDAMAQQVERENEELRAQLARMTLQQDSQMSEVAEMLYQEGLAEVVSSTPSEQVAYLLVERAALLDRDPEPGLALQARPLLRTETDPAPAGPTEPAEARPQQRTKLNPDSQAQAQGLGVTVGSGAELGRLERDLEEASRRLAMAHREIRRLTDELESARLTQSAYEPELQSAQQEVEQLRQEVEKLKKCDVVELRKAMELNERLDQEILALRNRVRSVDAERRALLDTVDKMKTESVNGDTARLQELQQHNQAQVEGTAKPQMITVSLQTDPQNQEDRGQQRAGGPGGPWEDHQELLRARNTLQQEVRELSAEKEKQEENLEDLMDRTEDVEEEYQALRSQREEEEREYSSLKEKCEELRCRAELEELFEEAARRGEALRELQRRNEEEEKELRSTVERLEAELARLGSALVKEQQRSEQQLQALQTRLDDAREQQLQALQTQLDDARELSRTQESRLQTQESRLQTQESHLQAQESHLQAQEEEVVRLQKEAQHAQDLLSSSEKEVRRLQDLLTAEEQKVQHTQDLLSSSQQEAQHNQDLLSSSQQEARHNQDLLTAAEQEAQHNQDLLTAEEQKVQHTQDLLSSSQQELRRQTKDKLNLERTKAQLELDYSKVHADLESSHKMAAPLERTALRQGAGLEGQREGLAQGPCHACSHLQDQLNAERARLAAMETQVKKVQQQLSKAEHQVKLERVRSDDADRLQRENRELSESLSSLSSQAQELRLYRRLWEQREQHERNGHQQTQLELQNLNQDRNQLHNLNQDQGLKQDPGRNQNQACAVQTETVGPDVSGQLQASQQECESLREQLTQALRQLDTQTRYEEKREQHKARLWQAKRTYVQETGRRDIRIHQLEREMGVGADALNRERQLVGSMRVENEKLLEERRSLLLQLSQEEEVRKDSVHAASTAKLRVDFLEEESRRLQDATLLMSNQIAVLLRNQQSLCNTEELKRRFHMGHPLITPIPRVFPGSEDKRNLLDIIYRSKARSTEDSAAPSPVSTPASSVSQARPAELGYLNLTSPQERERQLARSDSLSTDSGEV